MDIQQESMEQMHHDPKNENAFQQMLEDGAVFGRVEPGPFLEAKIMRRLDAEMQASTGVATSTWRLGLAGLAVLFAINAISIVFLTRPTAKTEAAAVSVTESYWAYENDIIR